MKKLIIILSFIIISYLQVFAQGYSISGKIIDENNKILIGATVTLLDLNNKTVTGDITNKEGKFTIKKVKIGNYNIRVSFVGYDTYEQQVKVNKNLTLGSISIKESEVQLDSIEVTDKVPAIKVKDDTTEINAKAYKTFEGSTVEDLVKKMPGVQVSTDGTVKAQGETVKKVLVDGKEFFGDDPSIALKNLPSDIVDKIQIFDKMSDQSEFTGFDDGNSQKTMNIITKSNRRRGYFGNLYAAGGYENKYNAGGTLNYFNNDQKITIIGLTNNLNLQNFMAQDVVGMHGGGSQMGGGGDMGPGGPPSVGSGSSSSRGSSGSSNNMFGQSDGISKINSFGANYIDQLSDKVSLRASYFFNNSNNTNNKILSKDYYLDTLTNQIYGETDKEETDNYNHRINMNLKWDIDSSNSIIVRPNISYQSNNDISDNSTSTTMFNNQLINSSINKNSTDSKAFNFSNDLLYRLKFNKKGRTFSIALNTKAYNKQSINTTDNITNYYGSKQGLNDTVSLMSNYPINTSGYSINAMYTEPIDSNSIISINYGANYATNKTDKKTFDADTLGLQTTLLDSIYSSSFKNTYLTQNAGLGYKYKDTKMSLGFGANYQHSYFDNNQTLPRLFSNSYNFDDILPNAMFTYKFSKTSNVRIMYRASTNLPTVDQLQDYIDNSNPLYLTSGNPALKEEYSHNIVIHYGNVDRSNYKMLFAFASLNFKSDYIANSTFLANTDTVIGNNLSLAKGVEFVKPVNLNGYINLMSFVGYSIPVDFISSNINFHFGGSYSKYPGLLNNILYTTHSYNGNFQLVIGSNISENVDFTISSKSDYNYSKNNYNNTNSSYINQTTNIQFRYRFWDGFFLQTDFSNNYYAGISDNYVERYNLLNFSLGYRFYNSRGVNFADIKLGSYDLLNQNQSIHRTITDLYIQTSNTSTLQRYYLLTFTYYLKNLNS